MSLEAVADSLYALTPDEFIAARNDEAKKAKADDDKPLAEAVKRLAKPALAAWVVNMLVRHEADQMEQVLTLGESLRQAQENLSGDALRELGKQRRQLTAAVTTQARALAAQLGHKIGDSVADQVQQTLHAAMVDEGAAAAVRSGLLTQPLAATGVGPVDLDGAVAMPEAVGRSALPVTRPRPTLTVVPDDTKAIEEATRGLAEADAELAAAEKKLGKAETKVSKLEARALQLQAELEELRHRVAEAEHQLEATDEELSSAEAKRESAKEAFDEARDERQAAAEKLRRLESKD